MSKHHRHPIPLDDRGPLRVLFIITSMPVGGAETLLVNLIRRLDRDRLLPELCCLKELGPLGEQLARDIPTHAHLLTHKYDLRVFWRLSRLLKQRRIDAVVTVGAGDKMFWGRLAAWHAGVPVVISALHSTGWPDGIGRLNRLLSPLTDAFVGVAAAHGRHLVENERFPAGKVHVIPNGVDAQRFRPRPQAAAALRAELGLSDNCPVCGIVAALRPEKNHALFLQSCALVKREWPDAQFVIVGYGQQRGKLEALAGELALNQSVHFLGARSDIPELLSLLDVFVLSSHNEASPVSILEAMSTGVPVVSTRVGSISESVQHGQTGYLVEPGNAAQIARHVQQLLEDPRQARAMGQQGRLAVIDKWSLARMVQGYENLIRQIYQRKCTASPSGDVSEISREDPILPVR